MVIKYKYGFEYKGFLFGWKNKKLHRLPSVINLRSYPLKELPTITIGLKKKKGYRVARDKKTIDQLMEMTETINYKYVVSGKGDDDCPF